MELDIFTANFRHLNGQFHLKYWKCGYCKYLAVIKGVLGKVKGICALFTQWRS